MRAICLGSRRARYRAWLAVTNDTITYEYDALGRVTTRAINGASNTVTWADAIHASALCSFGAKSPGS